LLFAACIIKLFLYGKNNVYIVVFDNFIRDLLLKEKMKSPSLTIVQTELHKNIAWLLIF